VNQWQLQRAVWALDAGGIVLHATEGVWGLACDPYDESAVARLLVMKGRPVSKGLIVIGAEAADFRGELSGLNSSERTTIEASWPGGVTWVVANVDFPFWITGGRASVAIRVPGHRQARSLCNAFGRPLVSTSANQSGRNAPVNCWQAHRQFARAGFPGLLDYVLPGTVCDPGQPSQIRTPAASC
jgi:L-threonylcarbamoyladenylate synthase